MFRNETPGINWTAEGNPVERNYLGYNAPAKIRTKYLRQEITHVTNSVMVYRTDSSHYRTVQHSIACTHALLRDLSNRNQELPLLPCVRHKSADSNQI